jgi:hypothetical protein
MKDYAESEDLVELANEILDCFIKSPVQNIDDQIFVLNMIKENLDKIKQNIEIEEFEKLNQLNVKETL